MSFTERELKIVFSIIKYLQSHLKKESLDDEKKESLDVGLMCIQEVFGVHIDDPVDQTKYGSSLSLDEMFCQTDDVDMIRKQEAEKLKNEGNSLLKENKHQNAIELYTRAIQLDPSNSTYYSNRAAAYIKVNDLQNALEDCQKAVSLNPNYSRAYGRMGSIYKMMNLSGKAKDAFKKALELDPDNAEYKTNLENIEQTPQGGAGPGVGGSIPGIGRGIPGMGRGIPGMGRGMPGMDPSNLGNIMTSPMFMNLASSVMSNPAFQNIATSMFQSQTGGEGVGRGEEGGGGGGPLGGINISEMMPQLAQMAQQVQENNPGAFETLREQAARFQPCHNDQPEEKKD